MEVMAEICIEVCAFVNPLISELHSSKSKDKCSFCSDYGIFWVSKMFLSLTRKVSIWNIKGFPNRRFIYRIF